MMVASSIGLTKSNSTLRTKGSNGDFLDVMMCNSILTPTAADDAPRLDSGKSCSAMNAVTQTSLFIDDLLSPDNDSVYDEGTVASGVTSVWSGETEKFPFDSTFQVYQDLYRQILSYFDERTQKINCVGCGALDNYAGLKKEVKFSQHDEMFFDDEDLSYCTDNSSIVSSIEGTRYGILKRGRSADELGDRRRKAKYDVAEINAYGSEERHMHKRKNKNINSSCEDLNQWSENFANRGSQRIERRTNNAVGPTARSTQFGNHTRQRSIMQPPLQLIKGMPREPEPIASLRGISGTRSQRKIKPYNKENTPKLDNDHLLVRIGGSSKDKERKVVTKAKGAKKKKKKKRQISNRNSESNRNGRGANKNEKKKITNRNRSSSREEIRKNSIIDGLSNSNARRKSSNNEKMVVINSTDISIESSSSDEFADEYSRSKIPSRMRMTKYDGSGAIIGRGLNDMKIEREIGNTLQRKGGVDSTDVHVLDSEVAVNQVKCCLVEFGGDD